MQSRCGAPRTPKKEEQTRPVAATGIVQTCTFVPASWDRRWLDEAPRVSARRRWFGSLTSQRLLGFREKIPASQAPFNRMRTHSQHEAPLCMERVPYQEKKNERKKRIQATAAW